MPNAGVIRAQGVVIEVLPKTLFRIEMPNGHRLLAHVARREQASLAGLAAGEKVEVELSPGDLSHGRITARKSDL